MPRSVSKSLLASVLLALCRAGDCADSGLRGPALDLLQSQRRNKAKNEPNKPKVKATRTKAQDEVVLQAAKHAHGDYDCKLEVVFVTPDFVSRAGSPKDIRKWEKSLAKCSRDDKGVFGGLELKEVEVDWQAAVVGTPNHRALLEDLAVPDIREPDSDSDDEEKEYPYWYKKYYEDNFIRGFNNVMFWSKIGRCQICPQEEDDMIGNRRNLKGLSDAASARFAEDLFNKFKADKGDKWMANLVYLHLQGDCGPGLKIDAIYRAPPPPGMPLVVDGANNKKPLVVDKGNGGPLVVDGAS